MEDPVNTLGSKKESNEKDLFKDPETPTPASPAARVTQFLARKLLHWGVEERGEHCYVISDSVS
jgi:hypothetical protein